MEKEETVEKLNMEELEKPEVFISYSTRNADVADMVVTHLEQNGIKCWYAPRNIEPGQEWVSAINEALREAKVFLLIYTEESNASRQVMNEVALAFNGMKTIVPLRLSALPSRRIPILKSSALATALPRL